MILIQLIEFSSRENNLNFDNQHLMARTSIESHANNVMALYLDCSKP